jgi:tripartite-type tricarboxylate transporter receptor subunit TctC
MKLPRRKFLGLAATAAAVPVLPRAARAQTYPTRPVRWIVPYPAGGATDLISRLMGQWLTERLGQPVIIDNRPGGGTNIGTQAVVSSPPDGYTLLFTASTHTINVSLQQLPFNFLRDITLVSGLAELPLVMDVSPKLPVKDLKEFVAYAKANPGKVSYASPGFSTQPHLLGEMLKLTTGADIVHVPYKGSAPVLTDLIAGQVQMYFDSAFFLLPHIQSGKVRVLAVADESRLRELPDTPTTIEAGFGKLQASYWVGIVVPAGTPAAVVERLNGAINEVITSKAMEQTLTRLVARARPGTPQDFAKFIASESKKWADVITAAGIKME